MGALMGLDVLVSALQWDPEIRGPLILLAAVLILPGSVYLLLLTNIGARTGFLVAMACLFGWMTLLGLLWTATPSATGPKGRDPHWKVESVLAGDLGDTVKAPLDTFPREADGWKKIPEGDPALGEASTAAEAAVSEGDDLAALQLDEVEVKEVYEKGGEDYFLTLLHKPHYAVAVIEPQIVEEAEGGTAPPEPRRDPSKPDLTVLMVRDLGTRRLPPFLVFISSATIFGVLLSVLHRRDRMAMALRTAG